MRGVDEGLKIVSRIKVNPFFKDFLTTHVRYKGIYGGRGSGKSHFGAQFGIIKALTESVRIVYIREYHNTLASSVKSVIVRMIEEYNLSRFFIVQRNNIYCKLTGSRIFFIGLNNTTSDNVKSFDNATYFIIDEAQVIGLRSMEKLDPTLRKDGAELLCLWNPEDPNSVVDQMFRGENAYKNKLVIKANWNHNTFLNPELYELRNNHLRNRPKTYDHVWEGDYLTVADASVFDGYFTVKEFNEPTEPVKFYFGADWGFSNDPTVLVRCYILNRCLYIDRELFLYNTDIDKLPALFDKIPKVRNNYIIADNSRPETISYLKKHGFKIKPCVKGGGSVEDGIEHLKEFDNIFIHRRCVEVQKEFRLYSYKVDAKTGVAQTELIDKYNHSIDALRYALQDARTNKTGLGDIPTKDLVDYYNKRNLRGYSGKYI